MGGQGDNEDRHSRVCIRKMLKSSVFSTLVVFTTLYSLEKLRTARYLPPSRWGLCWSMVWCSLCLLAPRYHTMTVSMAVHMQDTHMLAGAPKHTTRGGRDCSTLPLTPHDLFPTAYSS